MKIDCFNCQYYRNVQKNMLGHRNIYCTENMPYRSMKPNCEKFNPTHSAIQTSYLKELYSAFVDYYDIVIDSRLHNWTIVDDSKRYKRISGNNRYFLKFENEAQLEEFYNKNFDVIKASKLQ